MIKLLIVEDEYLMRERLVKVIDWASIECEVVGEAENGVQAVEIINKEVPDIVLTDIRMPQMDGLELAKYIKNEFPFIKVVIMSGYNDFNYAQEALRVGVNDYILKPSDKEEILNSIYKVVSIINNERRAYVEQEEKSKTVTQNLTFLRAKIFDDIINGFSSDIEKQYDKLGDFIKKNCTYVIVSIELYNGKNKNSYENQTDLHTLLKKTVEKYSCEGDYEYIVSAVRGSLYTILFFDNSISSNQIIEHSKKYAVSLQKYVNEELQLDISIGISRCCIDINDLSNVYWEAQRRLKKETFISKEGVLVHVEDEDLLETYSRVGISELGNLIDLVRNGEQEAVFSYTTELFNEIAKSKDFSLDYLRSLCTDIVLICTRVLNETNKKIEDAVENDFSLYFEIAGLNSLQDFIDWTNNFLGKIKEALTEESKSVMKKSVAEALELINNNYMEDISLTKVAEHIHVHPVYLGRLLRKELGENFSDILLKVRVENAKKLLKDLNTKAYEVAYNVGIKDPHYFSQVFKKYTGMTPTEYRESFVKK